MTEEQINKIRDIENLDFQKCSKQELINTCDLIISIWDLEEDPLVKDAITLKLNGILKHLLNKLPE